MFSIVPNPTFAIKVNLPRPDSDKPVPVTFTFKHKTVRDLNAWANKSGKAKDDVEFLAEVIEGWGPEIVGPDDKPYPFTKAHLRELLDRFPGAGAAIYVGYRARLQDARLGN
jgi:hypothetical protein